MAKKKYLWEGSDWSFEKIDAVYKVCEKLGKELKLNIYPNQIEIVSSDQMIDATSSSGLPLMYNHWSFGKSWVELEKEYRTGRTGLAYELVINSSPCIAYLMEENSMLTQALVVSHASFGHNHFFKNNYLFKQWSNADSIIDYLAFAKKYITSCEEKYGASKVEEFLDHCHALQLYGVNRYKKPAKLSAKDEIKRLAEREEYRQQQVDVLWSMIPKLNKNGFIINESWPKEPEENILYFLEKNAPKLKTWQREILRIVRKISQYYFANRQTKLMNEGFATWTHHTMINTMYDRGYITDGAMIEFLKLHTNVLMQPGFDSRYYSGINPYALGFAMFKDIERACNNPTEEDKEFYGDRIKNPSLDVILDVVENFRDESFVLQFLSPKVIRDFKLFSVFDDDDDQDYYVVKSIHNEHGYRKIRQDLARQYEYDHYVPDIQIVNCDIKGDRKLTLQHNSRDGKLLTEESTLALEHLRMIWGYPVTINTVYQGQVLERDHSR